MKKRITFKRKAYTVKGKAGIEAQLKNGKTILTGTRKKMKESIDD
ncbi:MAG: hypothetical protein PVF73_07075 [Bacteroidales bacterium]